MDKSSDLFRKNLKALRVEKNLTQWDLSDRLGRKSNVVETYEGGRRWPDPEDIDRLAKALSITPARLFLKPGEIPQPTTKQAIEIVSKIMQSPLISAAGSLLTEIDSDDIEGVIGFILKTRSTRQNAESAGLLEQSRPGKKRKLSQ